MGLIHQRPVHVWVIGGRRWTPIYGMVWYHIITWYGYTLIRYFMGYRKLAHGGNFLTYYSLLEQMEQADSLQRPEGDVTLREISTI